MKIERLKQTCCGCPSQWQFWTDNGRAVYVRYRWGCLSVSVSPDQHEPDADAAVNGPEVYYEEIGHGFDGFLDWEEVEKRIAGLDVERVLSLRASETKR